MRKTWFVPLAYLLLAASLAGIVFYSYVWFYLSPYPGFEYSLTDGEIYPDAWGIYPLQDSDVILEIDGIPLEQYRHDLVLVPFGGYRPGDVVDLRVQRGAGELTIPWKLSSPLQEAIRDRLRQVWVPYLFWLFGLLTALLVRPRDTRWLLLVSFDLLTGFWFMTGLVSNTRAVYATIVMRVAIWLCLPLYLHLHWVFPYSLRALPKRLLWGGYLAAALLAAAQVFQWLPANAYLAGFLLAVLGSITLALVHLFDRSRRRGDMVLIMFAIGLSFLPSIVVAILYMLRLTPGASAGAVFTLIALPGIYFYTAARRRFGGLEVPFNRVVGLLFFLFILFSIIIPIWLALHGIFSRSGLAVLVDAPMILAVALLSVRGYPAFQRWFERRILNIPLDIVRLTDRYAERITTALDLPALVSLLQDEVIPSLLIRQSALLYADDNQRSQVIYAAGVELAQLPTQVAEPALLAQAGRLRQPVEAPGVQPYPWVRLALPLRLGQQQVGLWLLGQHDPDDYYSQAEIDVLQNLAHQTSIALANIYQARRLHALYQNDIERQEEQRHRLARGLHDDVLVQMALLRMSADVVSPQFDRAYEQAVEHTREVINSLHPVTLINGLRAALDQLADDMLELAGDGIQVKVDLPQTDFRYPEAVELQLYRIAQQGCRNALQHAQPSRVTIGGCLEEGRAELIVEDDGIGMPTGQALDLTGLLANQHFGLAGMYERAALIGACLTFDPAAPHGTRISVAWSSDQPRN